MDGSTEASSSSANDAHSSMGPQNKRRESEGVRGWVEHLQVLTEQSQDAVMMCCAAGGASTQDTASSCAAKLPSCLPCCVANTCRDSKN